MAYFVTAAHVAKGLSGRPIYFLVNRRGGGVTGISSLWTDQWWVHPTDKTADVVVVPIGLQADADIKGVTVRDFVTQDDFTSKRVGVGDETFMTGLFTEAPGITRNMPIVRNGNIAMLPDEPIQTELGHANVYLVEARSIGGLSGSPVFVRAVNESDDPPSRDSVRGLKLLGLMHGHWDIKESEMNKAAISHDRKRGVNLGIGIVTPAAKISEIINSPHALETRMEFEEMLVRKMKSIPGTDSTKKEKVEDRTQFTKVYFENALKKASRKIEPTNQ
jgi:hypothetical protein